MNDHQYTRLSKELRMAGASDNEIEALLPIASSLKLLRGLPKAGDAYKRRQPRFVKTVCLAVAGSCLAVVALVIVSQLVSPTSWLYGVQKLSDNLAVAIHPSFRATVMMKRARQVNELVRAHADTSKVAAALADYTDEAIAYKSMPHADYAAFEYCRSNLEQAASLAPPTERQAILQSLRPLEAS